MVTLFVIDGFDFSGKIHALIIYIIFEIIGFFMILVFIEIIQLNFCGLSTMTKKNIEERARLDFMLIDDNDDEENNKEDKEEVNKENNNKDKEEKRISFEGYSVELKDINIDQFEHLDTFENNI